MLLEKTYNYLQYIPYVSYGSAAVNLATKLFINCHKEPSEVAKKNWFYKNANECSNLRAALLCLPPFGNLTVLLYDMTNALLVTNEIFCSSDIGIQEFKNSCRTNDKAGLGNLSHISYLWSTFIAATPITMTIIPQGWKEGRGADLGAFDNLFFAKNVWWCLDKLKIVSRTFELNVVVSEEDGISKIRSNNSPEILDQVKFMTYNDYNQLPKY
ncbi:MAG: hypothetical protein WC222_10720 [Parachlamydiales bacterium]|jgi:hypothetical protein